MSLFKRIKLEKQISSNSQAKSLKAKKKDTKIEKNNNIENKIQDINY